jgi:hypothetical protein
LPLNRGAADRGQHRQAAGPAQGKPLKWPPDFASSDLLDYLSSENACGKYRKQLNNRKILNAIDHRHPPFARRTSRFSTEVFVLNVMPQVACVNFRGRTGTRRSAAKLISHDEARRIAVNIAQGCRSCRGND